MLQVNLLDCYENAGVTVRGAWYDDIIRKERALPNAVMRDCLVEGRRAVVFGFRCFLRRQSMDKDFSEVRKRGAFGK
jgi:hypothetical protein